MGGSGTVRLHYVQLIPRWCKGAAFAPGTVRHHFVMPNPNCGQSFALPTGTVKERKALLNPSAATHMGGSGTVKPKQLYKFIRK